MPISLGMMNLWETTIPYMDSVAWAPTQPILFIGGGGRGGESNSLHGNIWRIDEQTNSHHLGIFELPHPVVFLHAYYDVNKYEDKEKNSIFLIGVGNEGNILVWHIEFTGIFFFFFFKNVFYHYSFLFAFLFHNLFNFFFPFFFFTIYKIILLYLN